MADELSRPGTHLGQVTFSAAPESVRLTGLLGWVSLVVDGSLKIDGITVRRTRAGRLALSFPTRHDRTGRQHPLVRPVDARARRQIEGAVLDALGMTTAQDGACAPDAGRER